MAIPTFDEDVKVISKLGDTPGSDDGLSAEELKAKFDQASLLIKEFLNGVLIPHLNNIVDVEALLNSILDTTLTKPDKAANAKAVGDALREPVATDKIADGAVTQKKLASGATYNSVAVSLTVDGWSSNQQSVSVAGVTASNVVIISPAPGSYESYFEANVRCSAQGDSMLTFTCETVPTVELSVNVFIPV